MKIGIGEWGFRDLPIEEHCRMVRDFGLRYMELGIGGDFAGRLPRQMDQHEIDHILALCKDYGIKAPFICLENDFTLEDPRELQNVKELVISDIKLAHRFGATHVRLFTGFELAANMTEERWKSLIQAFVEMEELCFSLNMEITIETHGRTTPKNEGFIHEPTTTTDWDSVVRLLEELPRRVGINFDPGNLKVIGNRSLVEYAKLFNDRINYCHLKDWKRVDDYWVACGVGDDDINWDELLEATNFNGIYLIEYEQVKDIEDGIRRSLAYLQTIRPNLQAE